MWSFDNGAVKVNYFTSRFFERPNAENIENEIHAALKPVSEGKMLQLSMDGPNTNWKVFDLLQQHWEEAEFSPLLELGSCSLQMLHGAFQSGNFRKISFDEIFKYLNNKR